MENIFKKRVNESFRELWKNGQILVADQDERNDLKYKGRVLNALKEYPRLNIKRAFWRWYLNATANGLQHFQTAADNLVLYTNCNKITVFYRLLHQVRKSVVHVSLATKRKVQMMMVTLRMVMEKHKREAYNLIKMTSKNKRQKAILQILDISKKKQINCINIWLRKTKLKNKMFEEKTKIREIQKKFISKLMMTKTGRIVEAFRKWKGIP